MDNFIGPGPLKLQPNRNNSLPYISMCSPIRLFKLNILMWNVHSLSKLSSLHRPCSEIYPEFSHFKCHPGLVL